jgi:hypothetical protein
MDFETVYCDLFKVKPCTHILICRNYKFSGYPVTKSETKAVRLFLIKKSPWLLRTYAKVSVS